MMHFVFPAILLGNDRLILKGRNDESHQPKRENSANIFPIRVPES
jgi:hypothetical protein